MRTCSIFVGLSRKATWHSPFFAASTTSSACRAYETFFSFATASLETPRAPSMTSVWRMTTSSRFHSGACFSFTAASMTFSSRRAASQYTLRPGRTTPKACPPIPSTLRSSIRSRRVRFSSTSSTNVYSSTRKSFSRAVRSFSAENPSRPRSRRWVGRTVSPASSMATNVIMRFSKVSSPPHRVPRFRISSRYMRATS